MLMPPASGGGCWAFSPFSDACISSVLAPSSGAGQKDQNFSKSLNASGSLAQLKELLRLPTML